MEYRRVAWEKIFDEFKEMSLQMKLEFKRVILLHVKPEGLRN